MGCVKSTDLICTAPPPSPIPMIEPISPKTSLVAMAISVSLFAATFASAQTPKEQPAADAPRQQQAQHHLRHRR